MSDHSLQRICAQHTRVQRVGFAGAQDLTGGRRASLAVLDMRMPCGMDALQALGD